MRITAPQNDPFISRSLSGTVTLAVLAVVLLVGSSVLFSKQNTAPSPLTSPAPPKQTPAVTSAPSATAPPAAEDIVVLRLDLEGRCFINGQAMVAQDIPAVLQQHAKKIRQSAVLVETHADLPTRALIEAMDMIHECGIQRVAVLPFSD